LNSPSQLEILDLRHFSAARLKALLHDESDRWQRRLRWDYTQASAMLLEYLDGRILPGFVALRDGQIQGYAFSVFEGGKAVIGDIYAFHETESIHNPVCDTLLTHLLELLQATPGVDRIESQLLMFPAGALNGPFSASGFRSAPRLFMICDLANQRDAGHLDRSTTASSSGVVERPLYWEAPQFLPGETRHQNHTLQRWQPASYDAAAGLIHRCYAGHMDANINDQYRTFAGAQRFLHNIIRFPGCGVFDAENSWVLRDPKTNSIDGLLLCSRVRPDTGHITQLCINPSLRGHGLGQAMLHHCAQQIAGHGVTALSLTVTEANAPALQLYERNGFTTLHRFEAMVWDKSVTT
jgi:ribosomal protein S18 acetylase RimI-like enzyme